MTLIWLAGLLARENVIEKIHFSWIDEPDFAARLDAIGRDQAVICGLEAHVCVLQTALGLRERGFAVAVVADAVASRHPGDRERALARLSQAGVEIVTAEMVMFEWLRKGGTPEFKDLLALIK